MIKMRLILVFLASFTIFSLESTVDIVSQPTVEEISRGSSLTPSSEWGYYMRKQKSLRILVLGGSNSYKTLDTKYPDILDDYVKANVSSDSYCINEAIGGEGSGAYFATTFDFESYDPSQWPNLIMMEFSINDAPKPSTKSRVDSLIFYMKDKWRYRNVHPLPSILFIDLFTVAHVWTVFRDAVNSGTIEDTPLNRYRHVSDYQGPHGHRGCDAGMHISSVARFYGQAMISTADAMYPSFVRHFIKFPITSLWPYTQDCTHLNPVGHAYLTRNLIIPFLEKQLQPRVETYEPHHVHNYIYSFDVRMHPFSDYGKNYAVHKWTSWGDYHKNTLHHIAQITESWTFRSLQFHEEEGGHVCFGSSGGTSTGYLHLEVPHVCGSTLNDTRCILEISYIKSWNTSYVGDAVVGVYHHRSDSEQEEGEGDLLESSMKILGNVDGDAPMHSTVPVPVQVLTGICSGKFKIKIEKLDTRLSCISTVIIWHKNRDTVDTSGVWDERRRHLRYRKM